jgi:lysozyme
MRISEAGIDLIKRFEGLELESYQDIAGVWTIGYGHTETAGPNQKISAREADDLLRRDLAPRERAVEQLVKAPLNQNEFDALVSFVFNVGIGALKSSTALKRLNHNDRLGAADALTWWNKATVAGVLREVTGLTRRRASERALFLTPTNPPIVNKPENVSENSRVTPVEEAPRRENLGESRTVQGAAVAGGAGAAASTIGKKSAEDLDQLETNIENGTGLTEKPPGLGGLGEPVNPPIDSPVNPPDAPSDSPAGDPAAGSAEDGAAPDGAGDGSGGALPPDAPAADADATIQTIGASPDRPAAREKNAVDAQLQFALLIIIVLAALYIVFARVDDWFKYRR